MIPTWIQWTVIGALALPLSAIPAGIISDNARPGSLRARVTKGWLTVVGPLAPVCAVIVCIGIVLIAMHLGLTDNQGP